MKIGVMGANGFVGRSLCVKLLDEKNEVFAFYHAKKSKIPAGTQLVQVDNDFNVPLDVLIIAIGNYQSGAEDYANQLEAIKKSVKSMIFRKLIYISSTEVYGECDSVITEDSTPVHPNEYGRYKIACEAYIQSLDSYTIIRPTYLFGDDMNPGSLLPAWLEQAKTNQTITVYGDGSRKQDYLHVDDLVELCWKIIQESSSNETINAASGHSISNSELAHLIAKQGRQIKIKFQNEDNKKSCTYDISKARDGYNWSPSHALEKWIIHSLKYEDSHL